MVPAEAVHRFRADLEKLTGGPPSSLVVAVSGGPDSLALLLLARYAYPDSVFAATVDHGLRPESAQEAEFVAVVCEQLRVPLQILTLWDPPSGNLQAWARNERYRVLNQFCRAAGIKHLATAHHIDDQAETLLMRLARGSGVAGLAGVRRRRSADADPMLGGELEIIRPLLGWRREELRRLVVQAGITPADDPSNADERFDRTRFRSLLATASELSAERLAQAAGHLAEAEEALGWMADREYEARHKVEDHAVVHLDVRDLPAELLRRLVMRATDEVHSELGQSNEWRRDKLAGVIDLLRAGQRATIAGIQITPAERWRFEPAPPRRDTSRDPAR